MSDLISRQAAINAIENAFDRETILNWFVRKIAISAVRLLPSTQPEQRWIPVGERLPEKDEIVLVCFKSRKLIHICRYLGDGSENAWWSYIEGSCMWNNTVLAWMPLPEPYKEGKA